MLSQIRLAVAALRIYRDPSRLPEVLEAATRIAATNDVALLAAALRDSSPAASEAFRQRHIIHYELEDLAHCPEGSLGLALHAHCAKWGIHPSAFPKRPTETPEQYVIAHLENTHDIWHPVCGFDSDAAGEIGLQAFYMAQFPNLLGLLLLGVAHLHTLRAEPLAYPRLMEEVTRGWILGKRAKLLFGTRWDRLFDRQLDDVRRHFGIDVEGVARILEPGTQGLAHRVPLAA